MGARAAGWGAYRMLADALRARIASGEFPPGSMLPGESALCDEYNMARNTVRRALDQVADDGLILTIPGRGRQVRAEEAAAVGPRYRDVAAALRAMIESGELEPGDRLPSESTLTQRHGLARGTIRQALAELEGAGLTETVQGKGRFVRRVP